MHLLITGFVFRCIVHISFVDTAKIDWICMLSIARRLKNV